MGASGGAPIVQGKRNQFVLARLTETKKYVSIDKQVHVVNAVARGSGWLRPVGIVIMEKVVQIIAQPETKIIVVVEIFHPEGLGKQTVERECKKDRHDKQAHQ
jgi:hypothetical protein